LENNRGKQIIAKGASTLKKIEEELRSIDIDKEMDVISVSSHFSGDFNFGKYTRVEGKIDGKVSSSGILIITETGMVLSNIIGRTVVIDGEVNGDVTADKVVIVKENGVVSGNIKAPDVVIEHGARVNGNVYMLKYHPRSRELLELSDQN